MGSILGNNLGSILGSPYLGKLPFRPPHYFSRAWVALSLVDYVEEMGETVEATPLLRVEAQGLGLRAEPLRVVPLPVLLRNSGELHCFIEGLHEGHIEGSF